MRTGADLILEVLESEGIQFIFGNPGTTELPLVEALPRHAAVSYVLALHEATAVGMADGYAQASGRVAFANLHTASGLGNATGQIFNAKANGTPIVVTAGQQDTRHLINDPLLAADLVTMATPITKAAYEVRSLAELPVLLRRAIRLAAAPPAGPVFLSLPMDLLQEEDPAASPGVKSAVAFASVGSGLEEAVALLTSSAGERRAVVVDDEASQPGAFDLIGELAELLDADVYGAPLHGRAVFPSAHRLWAGSLPPTNTAVAKRLRDYQTVVYLGEQPFQALHYTADAPLALGTRLVHLTHNPNQLGRVYETAAGIHGDIVLTLQALLAALRARAGALPGAGDRKTPAHLRRPELAKKAVTRYDTSPLHPMAAVHALLRELPAGTPVVDEAISTGTYVRGFTDVINQTSYFSCRGGGLGWGMPAALGVSLALAKTFTVCVVGDGATMYSPQALWTAARERLPVLFVVVNNQRYQILKQFLGTRADAADRDGRPVLDLVDPPVDYLSLASALGLDSRRATTVDQIRSTMVDVRGRPRPFVLEIPIGVPR